MSDRGPFELSVVMPTYNRLEILRRALDLLARVRERTSLDRVLQQYLELLSDFD